MEEKPVFAIIHDLVKLMPIYDALAYIDSSIVDEPTKMFLRHKLAKTAKDLRATAKRIEERLALSAEWQKYLAESAPKPKVRKAKER